MRNSNICKAEFEWVVKTQIIQRHFVVILTSHKFKNQYQIKSFIIVIPKIFSIPVKSMIYRYSFNICKSKLYKSSIMLVLFSLPFYKHSSSFIDIKQYLTFCVSPHMIHIKLKCKLSNTNFSLSLITLIGQFWRKLFVKQLNRNIWYGWKKNSKLCYFCHLS